MCPLRVSRERRRRNERFREFNEIFIFVFVLELFGIFENSIEINERFILKFVFELYFTMLI